MNNLLLKLKTFITKNATTHGAALNSIIGFVLFFTAIVCKLFWHEVIQIDFDFIQGENNIFLLELFVSGIIIGIGYNSLFENESIKILKYITDPINLFSGYLIKIIILLLSPFLALGAIGVIVKLSSFGNPIIGMLIMIAFLLFLILMKLK